VTPAEAPVVFNVVWTGAVFDQLSPFVASQLAHSDARVRFIANACEPGQLEAMERFAAANPGRVVEIVEVSRDRMVRHGDALDLVLRTSDDGPLFALIDPDIVARGPFLDRFRVLLVDHDAVTSGKELWSDRSIRPADHPGVNGELFFDHDGFVFGSPHFAIYRRGPLEATVDRWGVGFSTAGNDLSEVARARLEELGRSYWLYDTGKVVNILLQGDGHRLCHEEHPALLHIGGVSHYLAPPSSAPAARGRPPAWGEGPDWGAQPAMAERHRVAAFAADVLRHLGAGEPAPDVPGDLPARSAARLQLVREALTDLVTPGC
jgi:hypothetical protein